MDMTEDQLEAVVAEVAARLRAARARANLTLREAGDLSGVHYVTLSRYEQGRMPILSALYHLAEAYGVDVSDLLPPVPPEATPRRKRP